MISRTRQSSAFAMLALLVTLAWPAHAQDTFTPWHVARIRVVTSTVPSPDGSRIAYVLTVPRDPFEEPDGAAWQELHVVDTATGSSAPFVGGEVNVREPQWVPDGTAISFLAKRAGDDADSLYVIPAEGGESRRVLTFDTDIRSYAWSPDGTRVAFVAEPKKPKDRAELQKKGFDQEVFEESLERARVWIAALGDRAEPRELPLDGHASDVSWSPDGRRLAVVVAPTPLVDDDLMQRRVHVVDPASGRATNLQNPGKLDRVAWSPDSRTIAIVSGEDLHDPAAGRLLVRPVEGGAWTDIIPRYEGHVRDIAWVDAETVVYIGDEGVETVIGQVTRDGNDRQTLVPAGRAIFTGIEVAAKAGVLALQAESPQHPPEVYTLKLAGGAATVARERRLTQSNDWLARMRFAPQEAVSFTARDGLELQGILIRPLDADPGKRYPLILTVHGGPESHDRNGWRTGYANPGQFGAAAGFAVFYPNYRGSTGRGVAFSKLGQGDAAGREFDDLVDAVDHLVSTGLVDPERVGITGGSYGGYATAWASTFYTDRFAAGVMFVGISNKLSKVGTTDIAQEEYLVHARKRVWDDWNFFLERSPVFHAAKSRTPLLILHGKEDPRVHPTQSLELYRHLKLHGHAPVRLVWYPGEQHGNRRAASRLDYSLRLLRWFEHYLQGPGGAPPPPEIEYERPEDPKRETTSR